MKKLVFDNLADDSAQIVNGKEFWDLLREKVFLDFASFLKSETIELKIRFLTYLLIDLEKYKTELARRMDGDTATMEMNRVKEEVGGLTKGRIITESPKDMADFLLIKSKINNYPIIDPDWLEKFYNVVQLESYEKENRNNG